MTANASKIEFCNVCGAPGAGLHYGGKVCSVCRVFFLRQTRRKNLSKCKSKTGCEIRPGVHDNCQSCRYNKCLRQGMRPQQVGKNSFIINHRKCSVFPFSDSEMYGHLCDIKSSFSAGFQLAHTLDTSTSAIQIAKSLLELERLTFNSEFDWTTDEFEFGEVPYTNVNVSLADVVMNSQACSSRSMRILGAWKIKAEDRYSLTASHCRGTSMYADFLTAAPEIHNLSGADKMKVVQHSYLPCQLFTFFYDIWAKQVGEDNLRSRPNRYKLPPGEQTLVNNLIVRLMSSIKRLSHYIEINRLRLEEMVLLKLIILFTAPPDISSDGAQRIRAARIKYSLFLSQLVKYLNPYMSQEECTARMYNLLQVRRLLEVAAEAVQQVYAALYAVNADGIAGALTYDIFIRKY